MTIFHVLKYPISDSLTPEQLNALPRDLFNRWLNHPDFNCHFHLGRLEEFAENAALLRKLIVEYEE